jgi:hypothetical protein
LRLEPCAARQRRRVAACRIALAALLHANGLERVRIVWDERRPRRSASGKLRRIVAAAR